MKGNRIEVIDQLKRGVPFLRVLWVEEWLFSVYFGALFLADMRRLIRRFSQILNSSSSNALVVIILIFTYETILL